MTNFLNRYEVDAGRPLDSAALHILTVVNRVALDLNLSYIVVGATARDLLLSNVFGFSITRATADVDFAVAVASWDRFRHIREALLASGEFSGGKIEHRIFLKTSLTTARIPVDLIPFGGISERGLIHWPPDWGIAMNVAGFEDAMAAALHVKVNDNLTIPIASLAGLAVLKLFAWFDRQSTSDKDALDLFRIISTYADAGNFDRIYVDEIRLIESRVMTWSWQGQNFLVPMPTEYAVRKR